MSDKNPFRNKPSTNVQQNVDDWGKTKFMPIIKDGNRRNLDRNKKRPYNDNRKSGFHQNKETLRFNEVAKGARPENPTPWNKYKDEIIFRQRDEINAAQQSSMESQEVKAILKQRAVNYRKSLVEQKKKEETKWEDFAECCEQTNKNRKSQNDGFNKKSDIKREFISKDVLQNFDSKKLTYTQNDKLRSVITKTTIMASENSLLNVVNEMKKKKNKKKPNKTIF